MNNLFRVVTPTDWIVGLAVLAFILLALMGNTKKQEYVVPSLPPRQSLPEIDWKEQLRMFFKFCSSHGSATMSLSFGHSGDDNKQLLVSKCIFSPNAAKSKKQHRWNG